jgi:hypothetical protein
VKFSPALRAVKTKLSGASRGKKSHGQNISPALRAVTKLSQAFRAVKNIIRRFALRNILSGASRGKKSLRRFAREQITSGASLKKENPALRAIKIFHPALRAVKKKYPALRAGNIFSPTLRAEFHPALRAEKHFLRRFAL